MSDYEISKSIEQKPISEIAQKLNISSYEPYGNSMAKVPIKDDAKGKLILVTSTNPTMYGEGKTTLSIGICDSLNANGYNSCLALREPSLGPVFGTKGGACGGGYAQVVPMDKINLHFTGDMHAITSANNLIAAVIDAHIHLGNELGIETVCFKRCMDLNDRALKNVTLENRKDSFTITAASEVMAIFCLATSLEDLKRRIGNILVGYTKQNKEIYVKDLHCEGAATVLLKDAFQPNLVQTLYHSPALIHGGPFANIAHGCNSIVATKTALSYSDYVITEAGFGSDMGALKFLDIKCRKNKIYPDLIVINTTVRSLKYHGDGNLEKGLCNLEFHIETMKRFHDQVLVLINTFKEDSKEEHEIIKNLCKKYEVPCLKTNFYANGPANSQEIATTIVEIANKKNTKYFNVYSLEDPILEKISKMCKNVFHAKEVIYKEGMKEKIVALGEKYPNYPICISKTPMSITDQKEIKGYPKDFSMTVTNVGLSRGAEFITIYMGNVLTMPGLTKNANYKNIDLEGNEIIGLF